MSSTTNCDHCGKAGPPNRHYIPGWWSIDLRLEPEAEREDERVYDYCSMECLKAGVEALP